MGKSLDASMAYFDYPSFGDYPHNFQPCLNATGAESEKNCSGIMDYYEYETEPSMVARERYIVPAVFGLIFLAGTAGNCLLLFILFRKKEKKRATDKYMASLAIIHLVFLLVCLPFTSTAYAILYWPFGEVMCK